MWSLHFPVDEGYCFADEPGANGCNCIDIYAQGVPAHIDYTGPGWDEWLPAPVEDTDGNMRAVFICGPKTRKVTERNGQEYVNALVVLSGAEYDCITFRDLFNRITDAIEEANKPERLRQEIVELQDELADIESAESPVTDPASKKEEPNG